MSTRFLGLVLALCLCPLAAGAEPGDWPQFLGPNRDGVSPATGLNLDWKAKPPKVLWKIPLGSSFCGFAVAGGQAVTVTKRGDRDVVVCLDAATGKEQWAQDAAPSYRDRQGHGSGGRATPTLDGGRAFCLLPGGDCLCLNLADGKLLWRTSILQVSGAKPRADQYYWGLSASPLVDGERVIVHPGGTDSNSYLALHRDTGKVLWSSGSDPAGYGSPLLLTLAGRRLLIAPTGQSVLGLDPATGKVHFRQAFGNEYDATCSTPAWTGKLLVVSAAYGTGCLALEIEPQGDGFSARPRWSNKNLQSLMAPLIVRDGFLFGCHGDLGPKFLRCLDLATGEVKWSERASDNSRHAFLAVEGHLLDLSERGTLRLLEANPARLVVKGELPNLLTYKAWAMPALSGHHLLLRDEKNALCLDLSR